MSDPGALLTRPALELGDLVRAGEISARELVAASLEQIEALNGELNAFTLVDGERALRAAEAIGADDPRPFAGVPIAVKDLFTPVAGLRQAQGSDIMGDRVVADTDATVVRRLREAGLIIVGLTSSPEFGILPVTEPRRFGPTRNPWDLERTPGGSSGGTGAAVAAGLVPLGHGSDGGGSLRIPAACCGLVGLKPSRGRISHAPMLGDSFLVSPGVLTRTVADTATALDALAGYEPGDATWAPPPAAAFAAAAAAEPGRLRVAVLRDSPLGQALDPACVAAVDRAAELLGTLGHELVDAPAFTQGAGLLPVFTVLWAAQVGGSVAFSGMMAGREVTEESVEPLSWALYEQGRRTTAIELGGAMVTLQAVARAFVREFLAFDVLLCPALGQRPVRIGEIDACSANPMEDFARSADFTPFTALWNVSGQPAVSLPLFHGDDGLPLAVQLVGRPADEATLLSLAAQLETAEPWAQRLSPLAVGVDPTR